MDLPLPDYLPECLAFAEACARVAAANMDRRAGPNAAVARLVGCSRQNAHQQIAGRKRCPAGWVIALSKATGVPRSELRPDLYPPEDDPDLKARRVAPPTPVALERAGQLTIPGTERKRRHVR